MLVPRRLSCLLQFLPLPHGRLLCLFCLTSRAFVVKQKIHRLPELGSPAGRCGLRAKCLKSLPAVWSALVLCGVGCHHFCRKSKNVRQPTPSTERRSGLILRPFSAPPPCSTRRRLAKSLGHVRNPFVPLSLQP